MFSKPGEGTRNESPGSTISVGLIGHPYLLHDDYINHRLVPRLQEMGVRTLFPEMLAEDELQASLFELVDVSTGLAKGRLLAPEAIT